MDTEVMDRQEVVTVETSGEVVASPALPPAAHSASREADALMRMIDHAAQNPAIDVDKLHSLFDLREKVLAKQAALNFSQAMVALNKSGALRVQKNGKVELITKDGTKSGEYSFAKWEDMDLVLRPLLNENGFWLSFDTTDREGGGCVVVGTLHHIDGHILTARQSLPLDTGPGRNNIQAMSSSKSYGKRYVTEDLLNIVRVGVDDDGVSGGRNYITHEDAIELEKLLTETNADRVVFMKTFRLKTLLDMPVSDVPKAFGMLHKKLEQQRRQEQKAGTGQPGEGKPATQKADKLSKIEEQAKAEQQQGQDEGPGDGEVERQGDQRDMGKVTGDVQTHKGADRQMSLSAEDQRRMRDAPRWLEEMKESALGAKDPHEIHAIFGHPKYPNMGMLIMKRRVEWMKEFTPDLHKQLSDCVIAKLQSFKTTQGNSAQ